MCVWVDLSFFRHPCPCRITIPYPTESGPAAERPCTKCFSYWAHSIQAESMGCDFQPRAWQPQPPSAGWCHPQPNVDGSLFSLPGRTTSNFPTFLVATLAHIKKQFPETQYIAGTVPNLYAPWAEDLLKVVRGGVQGVAAVAVAATDGGAVGGDVSQRQFDYIIARSPAARAACSRRSRSGSPSAQS